MPRCSRGNEAPTSAGRAAERLSEGKRNGPNKGSKRLDLKWRTGGGQLWPRKFGEFCGPSSVGWSRPVLICPICGADVRWRWSARRFGGVGRSGRAPRRRGRTSCLSVSTRHRRQRRCASPPAASRNKGANRRVSPRRTSRSEGMDSGVPLTWYAAGDPEQKGPANGRTQDERLHFPVRIQNQPSSNSGGRRSKPKCRSGIERRRCTRTEKVADRDACRSATTRGRSSRQPFQQVLQPALGEHDPALSVPSWAA
ncbi:uncharacterized protein LOC133494751 isoform X2 [Syngnathoides biaculeatus]|uniref:uncharacterized protein LOC133494751 isoform X2 n=1 Tax=Syngnathoides biaculeatus TaxID=300417 RepID=UPI002ADD44C1|nr:uncharacterized protein LOC133494751 isoform X2 [Syngnathoides biaculeatus]